MKISEPAIIVAISKNNDLAQTQNRVPRAENALGRHVGMDQRTRHYLSFIVMIGLDGTTLIL